MSTPVVIPLPSFDDPSKVIAAVKLQQQQRLSKLADDARPADPDMSHTEDMTAVRTRTRVMVDVRITTRGEKYTTGRCDNGEKVFIDNKYAKHIQGKTTIKCDISHTPEKKLPWKCKYVHS